MYVEALGTTAVEMHSATCWERKLASEEAFWDLKVTLGIEDAQQSGRRNEVYRGTCPLAGDRHGGDRRGHDHHEGDHGGDRDCRNVDEVAP